MTVAIIPMAGKSVPRNICTGTLRPVLLLVFGLGVPVSVAFPVDRVSEGFWVGGAGTGAGLVVSTSKGGSVVVDVRSSDGDFVDVEVCRVEVSVLGAERLMTCAGIVTTVGLD